MFKEESRAGAPYLGAKPKVVQKDSGISRAQARRLAGAISVDGVEHI